LTNLYLMLNSPRLAHLKLQLYIKPNYYEKKQITIKL